MSTYTDYHKLIEAARQASSGSYSPYSRFRVGAALACSDGSIFSGVNIENRSFGLTICAERAAVFAAVSAGRRDFEAIAVYSPDAAYPIPPCGACRQVLSEFASADFTVVMACEERWVAHGINELLPFDSLHELRDGD